MRLSKTIVATTCPKPVALNTRGFPIECLLLAWEKYKLGIAIVDRRFRFRATNSNLAEMNNLPLEAHPGKPLHVVLGPLTREVEPPLEAVFRTGVAIKKVPLTGQLLSRPDPVQFLQYFYPLVDKRGRVAEVGACVVERESNLQVQDSFDSMPSPPYEEGRLNRCDASYLDPMHRPELIGAYERGVVLSGRQREVLRLLAIGNCTKEISSVLDISVKTVETYRLRLMKKLQAPSLAYLVHYAIHHKIVDLQR
jgi:DNA-binding CsgD family transcriptional regulator